MGVAFCAIVECPMNMVPQNRRTLFGHYLFPKQPKLRDIWIKFCERDEDLFDPKYLRLCAGHFASDQFQRDLKSELMNIPARPKLVEHAIPTIKACDVKISRKLLGMENIADDAIVDVLSVKTISQEFENKQLTNEINNLKRKVDLLHGGLTNLIEQNKKLRTTIQEDAIVKAELNCDNEKCEKLIAELQEKNAALITDNINLKRAVINAEELNATEEKNVEDVMVLPDYTVVLYK